MIIALTLFAIPSPYASAANVLPSLTQQEKQEITNILASYDVNEYTIQRLLTKYAQRFGWDSFTPGKTPVSVSRIQQSGTIETISTYEDGSINISTVPDFETISQVPQTRSITGCQYRQSGSTRYWTNCDATVNLIVISMGFNFDYQNVNHQNPRITRYGPDHHHVIGAALSNFRFNRISNSQVRLSADLDIAFKGFPVGWTAWMQVNVTGDNAWTSNN